MSRGHWQLSAGPGSDSGTVPGPAAAAVSAWTADGDRPSQPGRDPGEAQSPSPAAAP